MADAGRTVGWQNKRLYVIVAVVSKGKEDTQAASERCFPGVVPVPRLRTREPAVCLSFFQKYYHPHPLASLTGKEVIVRTCFMRSDRVVGANTVPRINAGLPREHAAGMTLDLHCLDP